MIMHVVHWASILPLALLIAYRHRGQSLPASYWLVASGFFVSFVADIVAFNLYGNVTWVVTYFYPVIQLGLFALACDSILLAVVLVSSLSLIRPLDIDGPEIIVRTLGSIAIVCLARSGPWAHIMLVYCGLGTLFYLLFSTQIHDRATFMLYWYPYQACRLAAFAMFIRKAFLLQKREVPA